jgi:hypothetical protein
MKTNNSFKMDKEFKRILSTIDKDRRGVIKDMFVSCQVAFEQARRDSLRQKRNENSSDE